MNLFAKQLPDVSRETLLGLKAYEALLRKWTKKINLIAPATVEHAWERHIVDSSQVFTRCKIESGLWIDIGSGAGFPGLVCAVLAKERAPGIEFSMVESDARKCAFLRTVNRELNLNVTVHNKRIEDLPNQRADIISARALAPLDQLLEMSDLHRKQATQLLFMKGENWQAEVLEADEKWNFSYTAHQSITESKAVVLEIGDFEHV